MQQKKSKCKNKLVIKQNECSLHKIHEIQEKNTGE